MVDCDLIQLDAPCAHMLGIVAHRQGCIVARDNRLSDVKTVECRELRSINTPLFHHKAITTTILKAVFGKYVIS